MRVAFHLSRIFPFRQFSRKMCTIKLLSQDEAIRVDQELFNECGFSVDQLMELAGLSVAAAISKQYSINDTNKRVLICCGPGNNGGDGLVASRHLKLFGYIPTVIYPKPGRGELFERLVKQCRAYQIPVHADLPQDIGKNFDLVVDAVFGFSYKPPLRPAFFDLLTQIKDSGLRTVSVDIPSGWNVDNGPPEPSDASTPLLQPDTLISLTAPKKCAEHFKGSSHWLGGRFIPDAMQTKYNLSLPPYPGSEVCLLLK